MATTNLKAAFGLASLLLLLQLPASGSGASLVDPVPGSNLTSSTITFTWTQGSTGGQHFIYVGTTGVGSNDIHNSGPLSNATTSREVTGVPTSSIVYVRIWCETGVATGSYFVRDYSFNADADSDGILDTIDPNPGTPDAMASVTGSDYKLTVLGSGRVASLESTALFNATFDDMSTAETRSLTERALEQFEDDFDFIILASNQPSVPSGSYFGRFYNAQNNIGGIGKGTFDSTSAFGSAGKLQGAMHLTSTGGLRGGPSLHELAHNWGNSMSSVPTVVGGHWGRSNIGGQLGGWKPGTLVDLGGGNYQAANPRTGNIGTWGGNANGGNGLPYSNFELYTMGLIADTEVGHDIKIANDFVWDPSFDGTFSASSITTVTMAQVVATDGARTPGPATSQKNFRVLYLIITPSPLTLGEWAEFDEDVYEFALPGDEGTSSYNFWEATGGRASLTMDGLLGSLNNQSVPGLTIARTGNNATLTLLGQPGQSYTIESSINNGPWNPLTTRTTDDPPYQEPLTPDPTLFRVPTP